MIFEPSFLDEEKLIQLLKGGHKLALDKIYKRYSEFLFRVAFKRLNNWEDSSDLIQDLFFRLWVRKDFLMIKGSL